MTLRHEIDKAFADTDFGPPPTGRFAVHTNMADVTPEPITWLWPGRFAIGKLSIIAGDPGLGKSFLTLDIAARVSTGTPWPDLRDEPNPAGGVVLISGEDDLADTIRPRLDAAQADVRRVNALRAVQVTDTDDHGRLESCVQCVDLSRDLIAVEQVIDDTPGCRLVVVDPISAFLGATDSHKNADVRGVLAPVAELAARKRVAVIAVSHLTKNPGVAAMYRTMGSLAFVAAARSSFLVAADRGNKSRRLLLPVKTNVAAMGDGLAFTLVPVGDTACLAWDSEPVRITADEALAMPVHRSKRDDAKDWLTVQLASGPVPVAELQERAEAEKRSWRTIRRAQTALKIVAKKDGKGGWSWELPEDGQDGQHAPVATLATLPDQPSADDPETEDGQLGHLAELAALDDDLPAPDDPPADLLGGPGDDGNLRWATDA